MHDLSMLTVDIACLMTTRRLFCILPWRFLFPLE
jgi:hypothetical protein